MSTRISSLSIRTTVPSTTSPCLKLLMSESCSARSSSIVVGSGPRSRAGAGSAPLPRLGGRGVGDLVGELSGRRRPARRRPRLAAPSAAAPRRSGLADDCGSARGRDASAAAAGDRSRLVRSARLPRRGCRRRLASARLGGRGGASSVLGWRARRRRQSPRRSARTPGRRRRRLASGSGAGPPCCSSVKLVVSPCRWIRPENHERPERRSSR